MNATVAVLGGSTPFFTECIAAMAAQRVPPGRLALHGRSRSALDAMAHHGAAVLAPLGWTVVASDDAAAVLDGADVVVHQIRYGGMAGRHDDERLAATLGVPPDETLGPGGLVAAIRMAPGLATTAAQLRTRCPEATVVNLTNPLSVSTALLGAHDLDVLGVCELPGHTLRTACRLVGVEPASVDWSYHGLNHRGFLHDLRVGARELLPDLLGALAANRGPSSGGTGPFGVSAETISALGALPLKYFALTAADAGAAAPIGRAALLDDLRDRALDELVTAPEAFPASVRRRSQPWYAEAVVPLLTALLDEDAGASDAAHPSAGDAALLTISRLGHDGVAREHRVRAAGSELVEVDPDPPPASVRGWLARFERHERAVLAAVADPSPATIAAAVEADPLVAESRRSAAVAAVVRSAV